MTKNITSRYPLDLSFEEVFLDKEKIILHRIDNKSQEIFLKDVAKIIVRPIWWYKFLLHKTNDLLLINHTGEKLKLFNITIDGTNDLINNIKVINPNLIIEKLPLEIGGILGGLFRLKDYSPWIKIHPIIIYVILAIITIITIVLLLLIKWIFN